MSLEERFWSKVDRSEDCWIWKAARSSIGYGQFTATNRRQVGAHRFSYELANGPIPGGLCVLHRCDNPPCVNPLHLYAGTAADNMRDRTVRRRYVGSTTFPALHPERMPRAQRHGSRTMPEQTARGEQHGCHKLSSEEVVEIRMRYAAGGGSYRSLAVEYGVDKSTIGYIVRGRLWRCLLSDRPWQSRDEEDFQSSVPRQGTADHCAERGA